MYANGLNRTYRSLTLLLVVSVFLASLVPGQAAGAAAPSAEKRFTAALSATTTYYARSGFDVRATTPSLPVVQVSRKGTAALFRLDGTPSLLLTPVAAHHAAAQLTDKVLTEATSTGGLSWVRYAQFTPQSLPVLLPVLELDALPRVTTTVVNTGTRSTYTLTPRFAADGRRWTVLTTRNSAGAELITQVVLRDRSGRHLRELFAAAGAARQPSLTSRTTTFVIAAGKTAVALPSASTILDPRLRPELFNPTRYDASALEAVAREVLFAANRASEAVNRTVTGIELNAVLGTYHPHLYPGLQLRAVGGRLELLVLGTTGETRFCAQLTRYDYTIESLLLHDGPC